MSSNERVLVFGATGAIGQAICTQLIAEGASVAGVTRHRAASHDDRISWFVWPNLEHPAPPSSLPPGLWTGVIWAQGVNANDNIHSIDMAEHQAMYAVNVLSIITTLQDLLRHEKLAADARLVIVSSIWQNIGRANKLSYMVTKSALAGLVRSLSIDLGMEGKLVNAILPGPLDTPMTRAALSSPQIDALEKMIPTHKLPALSDICNLASFLVSRRNVSTTGQFLTVDGGFTDAKIF